MPSSTSWWALTLVFALIAGCTSESSEPTPAATPISATETPSTPETRPVESPPDPSPDPPPAVATPEPPVRDPRMPSPERVAEVKSQKMLAAEETVRAWMRGLGVAEGKIDPHHVDLRSVRDKVDDRAIKVLARNQAVESLRLDGSAVTGAGVESLLQLPNLKSLSLRACQGLRTEEMDFLFGQSQLERVDLTGCQNIAPEMFRKLGHSASTKFIGP